MAYEDNFYMDVARGGRRKYSVVHKFGRNDNVSTTFVPIAPGGIYRTPQVSGATTLRVKAGNANDTAAGSGARKVTLVGIDASGDEVTEEITTNGESAGTASTNSFIRLYRAYVSESGTYATQSAGSHSAAIVIENSAGTQDWLTINAADFPHGQSEVGVYTVPNGYTAFVNSIDVNVDSTKTADVLLFKRENILETAAPYTAMRVQYEMTAVQGPVSVRFQAPLGPYPAGTDIGFMAKVATTAAEVDVNFDIILISNT